MSLREQILAADDLAVEYVDVPQWQCKVGIRCMTAAERDAFEGSCLDSHLKATKLSNVRARLVCLTAVDEAGKRIFTSDDADALGTRSGAVMDRLFEIAQRVNGLSRADVDDLEKN